MIVLLRSLKPHDQVTSPASRSFIPNPHGPSNLDLLSFIPCLSVYALHLSTQNSFLILKFQP